MGKIYDVLINNFSGGISNDPRNPADNVARMVTNFDILTDSKRMIPRISTEDGDAAAATKQIQNFALAIRTGTTSSLYGYGINGTGKAAVHYKDLTTNVTSSDLDDNGWTNTSNNESSAGSPNFNLFVYYAKTGYIYGARAGTHIWRYDPTGSGAWVDAHQALTYTNIAQGLVASNDILYIPYDNKIASNNNGSWTTTALTLPTSHYITSICEYGNYLAIACASLTVGQNSKVFLWDKVSTSFNEIIDWGSGQIKILEEIGGELIGISLIGGHGSSLTDEVIFRKYNGANGAIKFAKLIGGNNTTKLPIAKQKKDNRLYFLMLIQFNGATRDGIWSVGRNDSGQWCINNEQTTTSSALTTADQLYSFILVNSFNFISYNSASTYVMSKTDDTSSYGTVSVYESKIFTLDDSSITKKLLGVTVNTEYLPSGGQIVLKYRKDEETSFTTIFTHNTVSSLTHSALNIESSGAILPEFKEIQFRIESTGNAVVTGLRFRSELIDKNVY